eukprot:366178-Chlamydomonas_euryale.AAC.1
MGLRTVHQKVAKAQLVVQAARGRAQAAAGAGAGAAPAGVPVEQLGLDDDGQAAASGGGGGHPRETAGLDADADVLPAPTLLSEDGQVGCVGVAGVAFPSTLPGADADIGGQAGRVCRRCGQRSYMNDVAA